MAEMRATLTGLPRGAGIALIRLRSLGDAVLMTPAVAALKAWRPDLRIAGLIEPRFAEVWAGNSDFNTIIPVPRGFGGRLGAARELRHFRPALTIGLHGGATAAWLARVSGAPLRATFLGLRHTWAYNLLTPPAPPPAGRARLHAVEHVLTLLQALGLPAAPPGGARVYVSERAQVHMKRRLGERGVTGPYVFLNTQAREMGMRWPAARFAELAAWLQSNWGLACVAADAGSGEALPNVILFSGTGVAELMALQAGAVGFIGNDGGPVHIAAALKKPLVVMYSCTDTAVWSPWQAAAEVLQANDLSQLQLTDVIQAAERAGFAILASLPGGTARVGPAA